MKAPSVKTIMRPRKQGGSTKHHGKTSVHPKPPKQTMPSEVMKPLTGDMDSNTFAQKATERFGQLKKDKTSSLYL